MSASRIDLYLDKKGEIGSEDPFGQAEALATLKSAIRNIPAPSCMALYGSWGIGKTTLLYNAQADLERGGISTAWFDPWPYERHQDVLGALLLSVLDQLSIPADRRKQLKSMVIDLLKAVGLIAASKLPGMTALALGGAEVAKVLGLGGLKPEDFAKHFAKEQELTDEVQTVRTKFKDLVDKALPEGEDHRLVVFLDDLDRCLPDHAVWLIEAVKLLLADQATKTRVVFVFGLDRLIISEAIRARFPDSTLYTGENYLEKIFDLSLEAPLPKAGLDALRVFTSQDNIDRIVKAFGASQDTLHDAFTNPVFANPRVLKRALNRLTLLIDTRTDAGKARVTRIQNAQSVTKLALLSWVAGAERFRTFRHFFAQASSLELQALDHAVKTSLGQPSKRELDIARTPLATIQGLIQTPGFVQFYTRLLNLKTSSPGENILKQHTQTSDGRVTTLMDFDQLMRQAGL